jgi:hypothetical protein
MRLVSPIVQASESEHRWREEISRAVNELGNPPIVRALVSTALQPRSQTVFASGASGAITLTLPSASSARNSWFWVKCINAANPITISATDLIDGLSTRSLTTLYQSLRCMSDGTTYFIL